MSDEPSLTGLRAGRRQFDERVAGLRAELHRYCARMLGSVSDGEDLVQETLAHAYYALAELDTLPPVRPWLFRIAHNRAIDQLRRYERRMSEPLDRLGDAPVADARDAEEELAHQEALRAALSRFLELPPLPRSAVILKDVLGHSLEEIAALLALSLPAVKAALHRGRARLLERAGAPPATPPPRAPSPLLARYAALFNARDWDGVRALLADDVRLDVLTRFSRAGRAEVGKYFDNYSRVADWQLVPAWLDGREVLAAFHQPPPRDAAGRIAVRPDYFIELRFVDGQVADIRDFRYVAYAARDAELVLLP